MLYCFSHRALQHAFHIDSSSSLAVRATARKSKHNTNVKDDDREQLVVALDIENLVQVCKQSVEISNVNYCISCAGCIQ